MLKNVSKEKSKWLSSLIIHIIFLCLVLYISGFRIVYSFQVNSIKNTKSILSETDTVYIDDDFNSGTPGWGIYCFDTIQHGINAVDTGGQIFVNNGVYYENIVIDKTLKIIGEDKDSTMVDGMGIGEVVKVVANYVCIKKIKVQNCGGPIGVNIQSSYDTIEETIITDQISLNASNNTIISSQLLRVSIYYSDSNSIVDNIISNSGAMGIYLTHASNNSIIENNIHNNNGNGLSIFEYCNNNTISDNTINSNAFGIYFGNWGGGENNIISENIIQNNNEDGIRIKYCTNNVISENTISNSGNYGIYMNHSSNLLISNNTIENNLNSGVVIVSHSHNNRILENEIKFNNLQGIEYNSIGNNNLISGNLILNNQQYGISITSEFFGGNNVFSGNVIESNFNHGIFCYNSCNHSVISGNTITLNYGNGIHITESSSFNVISGNLINNHFMGNGIYVENGSNNNYFTYNNLINNVINVTDEAENIWYNGYPSGGNYFDDYIGDDNFSGPDQNIPGPDGIGDTPYVIPGGNNQDQYPYVDEWSLIYPYPPPDTIFIDDDYDENTLGWGVDHYTSINWGVNSVAVNGIVYVANGLYNEHLYVGKRNQLIGEGIDSTIIDGNGERNVIYTFSESVKINGFKIQNSGSSNESAGIYIGGWYTTSNIITDNNLVNNNGYGLIIHWSSDNNKIYHNNFISNTLGNAQSTDMGYTYYWDNGYSIPFNPLIDGGNFWDDYIGEDNFSGPDQNLPGPDGIGDNPYYINDENSKDYYPLMEKWNSSLPEVPIIVYVDDDYNDSTIGWGYNRFNLIQDGINAIETGGTVNVRTGVYTENISIIKRVYLMGEDRDSSIIDGNGIGDVVIISADSVLFKRLTIQNCGISSQNSGLLILSSYNIIKENTIQNNYGYGIKINEGLIDNKIFHNNFFNNGLNAIDEGESSWDNGYPSGGNYWDNYVGEDSLRGPNQTISGPDGIGDSEFLIDGGNNTDNYPFVQPNMISALPAIIVYVDDDFDEYTKGWGYDHFSTIQNGINKVAGGGNLFVSNGTYYENVVIDKVLNVKGEDKNLTIVDGGNEGDVIRILSDSVLFSGFKIQNSGGSMFWDAGVYLYSVSYNVIYENVIVNNCFSIVLNSGSNHNVISCNTITNNSYYSLYIYSSNNNLFTGNSISNNSDIGIYFKDYSSNNIIVNNVLSNNGADGIGFYNTCCNNSVTNNLIQFNGQNGIRLRSNCTYNIISENEISENNIYGINAYSSSDSNFIFHNNIGNNVSSNANDVCANIWHSSYSSIFNPSTDGGNFWTDYTGIDNFQGPNQDIIGSDGIGDTLYNIPGGSNVDQYPFMEPNGWNITVEVKVFLEGSFSSNEIKPILNSKELLPLAHPYNNVPWNYDGYEGVSNLPTTDIVDWIFVELRDTILAELATSETTVDRRSAFLLSDGSVVDLDGYSKLQFNYMVQHNLFVVIKHRNHLSIMSADPLIEVNGVYSYDFTVSNSQAYLSNQKELSPGVWGMIAGDADASGLIDENDKIDLWQYNAGLQGYFQSDLNLDSQVNNLDKNDFWLPNLGLGTQVPE